jgi:hypothetical protein
VLAIFFLLLKALLERGQSGNDSADHQCQGNEGPENTPAMRRTTIALCENAGVGRVDFPQDEIVADVPYAVQRAHDTNKELYTMSETHHPRKQRRQAYHNKPQRLSMTNKPTSYQQAHSQQNRHNGQPILAGPPQRQQKAHAEHNTRNLGRHNVETAKRQQCPDQTRPQIPSWQRKELLAAAHMRDAAFMGVERDGLYATASTARRDGVAELVEGNDKHLCIGCVNSLRREGDEAKVQRERKHVLGTR